MPPHKLVFVLNPVSGGIDKEDAEAQIRNFCRQKSIEGIICKTTGQDDARLVMDQYHQHRPDAIIAVGGDGTVNLVGTTLISKNVPMGIIPLGSGNGLSKDLHIPQNFEEALQVIENFHVRRIDTLQINQHPSLHLSDLGFNALVVHRFCESETRGPAVYAWHVMKEYVGYDPKEYEIITDNEGFKGRAFMVTIANANMFGSNATINPEGEINDGVFEICILEEFPKTAGINILYQLFSAEIHRSLHSRVLHCKWAKIINLENELFQIDGEPVDSPKELEIKILPRSLKVVMPKQASNVK
jgi:diacylglycerol kinase (ATP)